MIDIDTIGTLVNLGASVRVRAILGTDMLMELAKRVAFGSGDLKRLGGGTVTIVGCQDLGGADLKLIANAGGRHICFDFVG